MYLLHMRLAISNRSAVAQARLGLQWVQSMGVATMANKKMPFVLINLSTLKSVFCQF